MIHVLAKHGLGFTIFECHAFECENDLDAWYSDYTAESGVSITQVTYTYQTLDNMERDYPIFKHRKGVNNPY